MRSHYNSYQFATAISDFYTALANQKLIAADLRNICKELQTSIDSKDKDLAIKLTVYHTNLLHAVKDLDENIIRTDKCLVELLQRIFYHR